METYLIENGNEFAVNIKHENFTHVTAKIHQLLGSESYLGYVSGLFDEANLMPVHKSLASQLVLSIYSMFLHHLLDIIEKDMQEEPMTICVEEMDSCGKAKVRHVGGWVIRKLLEKSQKYMEANIFTKSSGTLSSVIKYNRMCELIEEALVTPFSKLEEDSLFPETLQVTENLQHRSS